MMHTGLTVILPLKKRQQHSTNFYEFGSSKNIWRDAQKLTTDPWMVIIDGLVEAEIQLDAEDLIAKIGGLEERLYRHRCVEAWAMAVPWTGVPLANLVKLAKPKPRLSTYGWKPL